MRVIEFALLLGLSHAKTLMEFLMGEEGLDLEDVHMSQELAKKVDQRKIESLTSQVSGGLVFVLPTDQAWAEHMDLYHALLDDSAAKLRIDLILAAGAEVDKVGGWTELLEYVDDNEGVIDSAYGTPIKIEREGKACLAAYDADWQLQTTECATLRLPPRVFDDGALYVTDKIILPKALWEEAGIHVDD